MEKYEITVLTNYGSVIFEINADNYESANEFAKNMNQGNFFDNQVDTHE